MRKYKGYYIDHVCFNGEKEIDEFIKNEMIRRYKILTQMFFDDSTIELNDMMVELAEQLNKQYGMSFDEIEQLEINEMIQYSGVNA